MVFKLSKNASNFNRGMQSMHGSDPSLWPQKNLVEGAAAYLIFESMEPDGLPDPRPGEQFMNRQAQEQNCLSRLLAGLWHVRVLKLPLLVLYLPLLCRRWTKYSNP